MNTSAGAKRERSWWRSARNDFGAPSLKVQCTEHKAERRCELVWHVRSIAYQHPLLLRFSSFVSRSRFRRLCHGGSLRETNKLLGTWYLSRFVSSWHSHLSFWRMQCSRLSASGIALRQSFSCDALSRVDRSGIMMLPAIRAKTYCAGVEAG